VDVSQATSSCQAGFVKVFFLDVRVEGVKQDAEVGMADLLAKLGGVADRVQELGFETVEWF
jgi:hypothetical protein